MKQSKDNGHKVYPLFYEVKPSDFRHQINEVKEAFDKHEKRHTEETRQKWRDALKEVADIHGWSLKTRDDESVFIEDIVKNISKELDAEFLDEQEVETMKSNLRTIQALLVDTEDKQYMKGWEAMKVWLDKLKYIAYDMEDMLDEWNTVIRISKINENDQGQIPSTSLSSLNEVCNIPVRIKELNEKYQVIVREKDAFSFAHIPNNSNIDFTLESPKTISLIDKSKVYGRDHEKDALIRLLLSEGGNGKDISLLAIVGMGGLGKTTLAQLIYNDNTVEKHFSQRIWVCVSHPFDEVRIAKAILEALQGTPSSFNEPEHLLQEIRRNIKGKKFLLVLDDVWTEDEKKWEPLKLSLTVASKESKILVTTRNKQVASILGCSKPVLLGMLSGEDSWDLFSKIAFSERSDQHRKNLESIGRKFVLKCAGLPLAIKTIASLLRFKVMKEQWERILVSDMWNFEEVREDLCAPLLLSYYDLPVAEKQCFRYYAIFPKDHRIERDELIKLWMAQGFLRETREVNDLEIIGVECFNNLAIRGFFQEFDEGIDGSIICKMHDIVHDFTQFLTEKECCLVESDGSIEVQKRVEPSSHENLRHLTLINPSRSHDPILYPFKKLRSFLILGRPGNSVAIPFASLTKLFDQLINLRMISFHNESWEGKHSLEKIPKEIGKLIHLRYLSLEGNMGLCKLPKEVCELYNLQTLNIRWCNKLQKLPHGMEKLINLRHFQNASANGLLMPKEMQRLPCLESLEEFYVGEKARGIESETSLTLKDLRRLIHLRGYLRIRGLGNVTAEATEAREAQLSTKTGLRRLRLCFDGGDNMEQETRIMDEAFVLEALQPPQDLHILGIESCNGPAYPNWMTSLTLLKDVELSSCYNWESLPPMGKLPSLEFLSINAIRRVKKVGEEFLGVETSSFSVNHHIAFPSLKKLKFAFMSRWEEWEYERVLGSRGGDDSSSSSSSSNVRIMPKLQYVLLSCCPKLKTLPRHILESRALQTLEIQGCPTLDRRFNKKNRG